MCVRVCVCVCVRVTQSVRMRGVQLIAGISTFFSSFLDIINVRMSIRHLTQCVTVHQFLFPLFNYRYSAKYSLRK